MKIYLFYLKSDNSLYAYTCNKIYKEKFMYQRNMKCFRMDKRKITDIEFSIFSSKHPNLMMVESPLSTSNNDYAMIISTYKEEDELNAYGNKIDDEMNELYNRLVVNGNLKDKYKESLEYLMTTSHYVKNGKHKDLISNQNMLSIFYSLFKYTFDNEIIDEDD